jgi:hypothetical protein
MSPLAGRALAAWDRFWHAPADPRVAAFFRIVFGLLMVLYFALQYPFVETFWGGEGLCPPELAKQFRAYSSWSLLFAMPSSWVWVGWSLAIVHAALVALGVFHRVNAALLMVWLISFQNRCSFINDGEDTVAKIFCFALIFLDASRTWALMPRKADAPTHSGFALRLIQLQTTFVFFVAGMEKWPGKSWWNGEAMFWVVHLDDYAGRLPGLPELLQAMPWLSWPMSTGTLLFEFVVPIIVWFRKLRVLAVGIAIFFHLALEAMSHLYLFEWFMILGWLTFLQPPRSSAPSTAPR